MKKKIHFKDEFLKALADWQKGWAGNQQTRRRLADALIETAAALPDKFRTVDRSCYRKRFILYGEIGPILLDDGYFEGVTSWTTSYSLAEDLWERERPNTSFCMVFKCSPRKKDVVLNISKLWLNQSFKQAVNDFVKRYPETGESLINFKDSQKEVILRSTLKHETIINIVGTSDDFDSLFDRTELKEEMREEISIKYARDKHNIPTSEPVFAGKTNTIEAVRKTIAQIKDEMALGQLNGNTYSTHNYATEHPDDLKHQIE